MAQGASAGVLTEQDIHDRAEKQAEKLLEELKQEVRGEVKDIGTLRKQVSVTVPAKVVGDHLKHNFDELRSDAILPGFRKGRAPRQLLEKRFGGEIRKSLKTSILGQSFFAVMEREKLEMLGDPLFQIAGDKGVRLVNLEEALSHVKLPDSGDFTYTCEVEIKPTFELPELKGIEIKSPQVKIADEDVDAFILRQRKIRGRYEPLENQPAGEPDDVLIADVAFKVGDETVRTEDNLQLGVRAARLDGIQLDGLEEALRGARAGDQRKTECVVPADYERADLRGKPGVFEFKINEVKRLTPAPLDVLLQQFAAEDEKDLRAQVRDDLEAERDRIVQRAKKAQVIDYLLANTALDVPANLSAKQTDRAVLRRVIELQQQGVPDSEIEARIDELRTSAGEQVARDLKAEFILDKVARTLEAEVTDEDLNSEIARMARLYHRRFDRVRDDLQKRGMLGQLAEQIRQDKCLTIILGDAKVTEVEAPRKQK